MTTNRLARLYRLAGTFLEYRADNVPGPRKAVLDDLAKAAQIIVSENEDLGQARVVSIARDRVVLRDANGEVELCLSFTHGPGSAGGGPGVAGAAGEAERPLDSYPYGIKQIGDRRWIFDRTSLLKYYQELRDAPDRLVAVFDSLEPDREAETGRIAGYRLATKGEPEFFDAAGLVRGDVVRSVNSLPMTDRGRAEFFIREFVTGNLNAFVLEVERGGNRERLVYQVR